jgi:peptidoglycan/xylan/chitin deacetylase (PgdA/CDA1 family)
MSDGFRRFTRTDPFFNEYLDNPIGQKSWRKEHTLGQGKSVLLSFDDGPAPVTSLKRILEILQANAITAEFYVIGSEVQKYPDGAKMIVERGHKIENHSWSHPNLVKASNDRVEAELEKTQKIIKDTTGATATKVRPPSGAGGWPGKYDPELASVANNLSLTIQNWDIDTEDWKKPEGIGATKIGLVEEQFKNQRGKTAFNILMHVQEGTARDLPNFITQLKEWGFSFAKPK